MKKNYEKIGLIIFVVFIFIFIEIIVISVFYSKKYRNYKVLSTIVVTSNYTKSYLDSNDYKMIRSGNYLYLDNKKMKYEIIDVKKNVLKQQDKWYHEVLLKIKYPNNYNYNDTITISVYNRKEFLFNIFRKCWEDDI